MASNVSRITLDSLLNASTLAIRAQWAVNDECINLEVFAQVHRIASGLCQQANAERSRLWKTGRREWMTPGDRGLERISGYL